MKLISAVIRPRFLPRLATALRRHNVPGVTVLKAQGFGREQAEVDIEQIGYMTDCVKIEIAIEDDQVETVSKLINETVGTGQQGDGIILVWNLVGFTRIERTQGGEQ